MKEMEWVVEHEVLPEEEEKPRPPDNTPIAAHRRIPWWIWPALMVGAAAVIVLAYLWQIGGEAKPLPPTDPHGDLLAATIATEITSISEGDAEIFEQTQDKASRRSQFHPPATDDANSSPAAIPELLDVEITDAHAAQAELQLTWQGQPYRMTWYYRLVNRPPQGTRWVHTDWNQLDIGSLDHYSPSPCLDIGHYPADEQAAQQIGDALQTFLIELCDTVDCVGTLFDPRYGNCNTFSITLDPALDSYGLLADAPTDWRVPSPMRMRWPADGRPEPLVLSSLARHLTVHILSQAVQAQEPLAVENQAALSLTSFWLAHHILNIESVPSTQWLDQAAELDGLDAVLAFQEELTSNIMPDFALINVFHPLTVNTVYQNADYFAWLLTLARPDQIFDPDTKLPKEQQDLLYRFDWGVDPWVQNRSPYHKVVPPISQIYLDDRGAIAYRDDPEWVTSYAFFRHPNGRWQLSNRDSTPAGEERLLATDNYTLTYWALNEPLVPDVRLTLDTIHSIVLDNFELLPPRDYLLVPNNYQNNLQVKLRPDQIVIYSPFTFEVGYLDQSLARYRTALDGITRLLGPSSENQRDSGGILRVGLIRWQINQLIDPLAIATDLVPWYWSTGWQPPKSLSSNDWLPLVNLWGELDVEGVTNTEDMEMFAWLVFKYIVETDGPGSLPTMLTALDSANSMETWIQTVTGRSVAEFEPAWHQWVVDQY